MNADSDSPLERAKERLRIPDVWRMLNLPGTPETSCKSPFREERNASFSVYDDGRKWKDHATGDGGDVVEFLAMACDLSNKDACRKLIELAGILPTPRANVRVAGSNPTKTTEEAEKAAKRAKWDPALSMGTDDDLATLSAVRGIGETALRFASGKGFLRFTADADTGERRWIVTDNRRLNAQARMLSGKLIPIGDGKKVKAKTLPGSVAGWPLGCEEIGDPPFVAVVEGGSDFLATIDLLGLRNPEGSFAVVAMLGAGMWIPDEALPKFAGKVVRIFADNDDRGREAAERWAGQIHPHAKRVEIASLAGIAESVKDTNDLLRIGREGYEPHADRIEAMLKGVAA